MLALIWDGQLRVEDTYPLPERLPGEALVRVRMAGICNTDLEILRGYKGFRGVLGHEFVGEVTACADHSWIGQRVCGEINIPCGDCASCRRGRSSHCLNRLVLGISGHDGAFAEFLTLPLHNLHPVPGSVPDEEAVFVEPLAAAFEILEQIRVEPEDTVVVLGDGKLGNLCAQVLQLTGARVTLVGKHSAKLSLAAALGVQTAHMDALPRGADVVVEATGSASGLDIALQTLRPRGTLVLKSTVAGETDIDLSPLVVNEITVVGSRCGPFPRAIDALVHRDVDVRLLISKRYRISRGVEAMQRAQECGIMKVLLEMPAAE